MKDRTAEEKEQNQLNGDWTESIRMGSIFERERNIGVVEYWHIDILIY